MQFVKVIVLVFLDQYEDLKSKLNDDKKRGKEKNNDIINFQNQMLLRRLISGLLMAIIISFFSFSSTTKATFSLLSFLITFKFCFPFSASNL